MSIHFQCGNPACGSKVVAPDAAAGRNARCPFCGAIQQVPVAAPPEPESEAGMYDLADLAEGEAAPPPAPEARRQIPCGECGRPMPADASVCPACGWVNPSKFGPPPPPARGSVPAGAAGQGGFGAECLSAVAYGFSNTASIFWLVLYGIAVSFLLRLGLNFFGSFLLMSPLGLSVFILMDIALAILVGGYYLRFYLDVIIGSLEGADQAPNVPAFDLGEMAGAGAKGLGIVLVYVLPVITLPLLPLGLLALGYANDTRAYDVRWALRSALKRPGRLAVLWVVLLLWFVVETAVTIGIVLSLSALGGMLMLSGCSGMLLGLLVFLALWLIVVTVGAVFSTVQFRCIGMLGRYCPELLDDLPDTEDRGTAGAFIGGGTVVSAIVLYLLIGSFVIDVFREMSRPDFGDSDVEVTPLPRPLGRPRFSPPRAEPDRVRLSPRVNTGHPAHRIECLSKMLKVTGMIRKYAEARGGLPRSLDDLVTAGLVEPDDLVSPVPGGGRFTYVPGQRVGGEAENILAYDGTATYDGAMFAARLSWTVEQMPRDRLARALGATRRRIAAAPAPGVPPEEEPRVVGRPIDTDAIAPLQYVSSVLHARRLAQRTAAMSRLRTVGTAMRMYEAMYGGLPPSLDALVNEGMLAREAIRSPIPEGGEFTYIRGQRSDRHGSNILVYDGKVVYVDKCVALRVDGTVVELPPETLNAAVGETHRRIGH